MSCEAVDHWVWRAAGGDVGARSQTVRLRTVVDGVHPASCGEVEWTVQASSWPIGHALDRAGTHGQPVVLTLRFIGREADGSFAHLSVIGVDVRGADDWRSALAVMRGEEPGPPQ